MKRTPLAIKMRPTHIDEIIGQDHKVGDKQIIRRMVDANSIASMILYGPPGTGKSSMTHTMSQSLSISVSKLKEQIDKKKNIEIVVEEAKMTGQMIIILDEVHRLDKAKQDFLLPHLEDNVLTMIGCTTSNPYHSINPAIRSRCHLFELYRLTTEQIKQVINH